jgi:hypothetical protein
MATPAYAGLTFRKWQFGVETVAGTPVAATYNPLVQGNPTPNVEYEEIPHDPNQFESMVLPVKIGEDFTLPLTGAALFQTLPFWFLGIIKGGVTPTGGSAKTWTFTPNQTADDLDTYTAEYGSNIQAWSGSFVTLREMELTMPETGGLWEMSIDAMGQSFGSNEFTASGSVDIDTNPSPLMGAFTKVFVDDTAGGIGTTPLSGVLRRGSIRFAFDAVEKKVMGGTGYQYTAIGRGQRVTEVTLTFEQDAASMTEVVHFLRAQATSPVMRYIRLTVDGNVISGGREKLTLDLPGIWTSFGFDEIGQNLVYTLTGRVKYDPTLTYGLKATVINTKADYGA